jgi:hypothetical protein
MPLLQLKEQQLPSRHESQRVHGQHYTLLTWPLTLSATSLHFVCRYWWLRDIVKFVNFALVASLVYVLATCYLDARTIVLQGTTNISSLMPSSDIGSSGAASCFNSFSPLQPNQSTSFQAPSALECSKLRLFPPCSPAADHARFEKQQQPLTRSDSFAPPPPAAPPTLQQQLYSEAMHAVASLSSEHTGSIGSTAINDSSSGPMLQQLRQPRQLLRRLPLLYLWRLWFMGDLFLVAKLGMCLACLAIATCKPGRQMRW